MQRQHSRVNVLATVSWIAFAIAGGLTLTPALAAPNGPFVLFTHRENLNLINADYVRITSATDPTKVQALVDSMDDNRFWNGGTGSGTALTVDLGDTQNIKTLRMNNEFSDGTRLSGATVEISPNGSTWSSAGSFTLTNPAGGGSTHETKIVLDTAANARYVRLTRTDTAGNQWQLNTLRMYGDTGTLSAGLHQDLIASSAYTSPALGPIGRSGYTGEDFIGTFLDDNPTNIADQKYYQWHGIQNLVSKQTWFQFNMGQAVVFGKLGIAVDDGFVPGSIHFQVHSSAAANNTQDDSRWTSGQTPDFSTSTLLLDYTGSLTSGMNLFFLDTSKVGIGQYLRVDFLDISNSGTPTLTRFGTVSVYQSALPEPASLALLGLGACGLLARRRRA